MSKQPEQLELGLPAVAASADDHRARIRAIVEESARKLARKLRRTANKAEAELGFLKHEAPLYTDLVRNMIGDAHVLSNQAADAERRLRRAERRKP